MEEMMKIYVEAFSSAMDEVDKILTSAVKVIFRRRK